MIDNKKYMNINKLLIVFLGTILINTSCNSNSKKNINKDKLNDLSKPKPAINNYKQKNINEDIINDSIISQTSNNNYTQKDITKEEYINILKDFNNNFLDTSHSQIPNKNDFVNKLKKRGISLKNKPFEKYNEEGVLYSIIGKLLNHDITIVLAKYWEGYDYLLINNKSYIIDTIWSLPIVNPYNNQIIVSYSLEWGLEGIPNGLNIVYLNKQLKRSIKIIQEKWIPVEVIWKDDSTLFVKTTPVDKYYDKNGLINNYFEYIQIQLIE